MKVHSAKISNPVIAFLMLILFMLPLSCKKEYKAKQLPPSLQNYIYAYTAGTISKSAPVKISFTRAVVSKDIVGQEVEKGLLNIKPGIEGTAIWDDDHTLVFQPKSAFESGQSYLAAVQLNKLMDNLPADLNSFEFNFNIRKQSFTVKLSNLQNQNPNNSKLNFIEGNLIASDEMDNAKAEKLIKAFYNSVRTAISWNHEPDKLNHRFRIDNLKRQSDDHALEVVWDGKPLDITAKGSKKITVPAAGVFKVLDANTIENPDRHIEVVFSDVLESGQNLEGLVTMANHSGRLRYEINGNRLFVYTNGNSTGEFELNVSPGIKNTAGDKLQKASTWAVLYEDQKPQIRLVGNGVIMPGADKKYFPFEAVGLHAVDVEVYKIFNNNILQFLQDRELANGNNLRHVGRVIMQNEIDLKSLNAEANTHGWARYALDLNSLIESDPGAIYQIRLGFQKSYSDYNCSNEEESNEQLLLEEDRVDENGYIKSFFDDYYGYRGYFEGYQWERREDPCYDEYYSQNRFVARNVFASNIGMIAKLGKDGSAFVAVSHLLNANPLSGVELSFYDFEQQLLRTTSTNTNGEAHVEKLERRPHVVVAKYGEEHGYLRLNDPNSLQLSRFDVSGSKPQKGLKGYIYGERGVWRPGDSLYLHFVLEDKLRKLPKDHPIQFELFDPKGQLQIKKTSSVNTNNVYPLHVNTASDAPTGNWRAVVKLGGAEFSKTLKIETVKPNRLKMNLDIGGEELVLQNNYLKADLQVNWLHGAPANKLNAKVELELAPATTKFKKASGYDFDDPARKYNVLPQVVFDGKTDADGKAKVSWRLNSKQIAPGKLKARFKVRAFEESGDFSVDNFAVPFAPFDSYAGVFLPEDKYGYKRLPRNKEVNIDFMNVDAKGEPVKGKKLSVGLYKVNWRWWWDDGGENVSRFNSANHYNAEQKSNVTTNKNGVASWKINASEWGRYMVRVCDEESGHCAGDFFFTGYPRGQGNKDAAAMLVFNADKDKYKAGEKVTLNIPAAEASRCLISIENGSKVLENYWIETQAGDNKFSFYTSAAMAPTVYAHVALVQPHEQKSNDMPIRMYGVIPIKVEDEKTKLKPLAELPDVLQPNERFNIKVKEAKGKPMAYTVALVDDGLLDLTRFKTPDPWNSFYAREALGVKTWDVYDYVLNNNSGETGRILSIGGDGEVEPGGAKKKANRFKPVVKHLGPFFLEAGQSATHEIMMPNYIGSVRAMVVACDNGAYGNTEKTIPVRKPLMILSTLPRVLGPGEELRLPVNVFAMEDKVKQVTVSLEETSGLVEILDGKTRTVNFEKPGDKMVYFDLKVRDKIGPAQFRVVANGNGENASEDIEIEIRIPNPAVTKFVYEELDPGGEWKSDFDVFGVEGTNEVILELSNIPPIDLGRRLNYLIRYPHGCIEQTTSAGFPQLLVSNLLNITDKQKKEIRKNVKATIDRLRNFQTSSGGFGYWPGDSQAGEWGSNYAGHFMLEAQNQGYVLPAMVQSRWEKYQKNKARNWAGDNNHAYWSRSSGELMQAYRLYTLALAGSPEWGAMNRMLEQDKLSVQARWRLAAAYAIAGKKDVAEKLVNKADVNISPYRELSYTYGSALRDQGMILETMALLGDKRSPEMLFDVAAQLSSDKWHATQTVAYTLLGIAKYVGANTSGEQTSFRYAVDGSNLSELKNDKPFSQVYLPDDTGIHQLVVENTSGKKLFARLIRTGKPLIGEETTSSSKLEMKVRYTDMKGKALNPDNLPQGTDFIAEVSVKNPAQRSYDEMALTQIFPSGWEIHNTRMSEVKGAQSSPVDYQDIRDDRVYTYFDVGYGKTQVYKIQLNAAYPGKYYLPAVYCEAMYDNTISATQAGQWIIVSALEDL